MIPQVVLMNLNVSRNVYACQAPGGSSTWEPTDVQPKSAPMTDFQRSGRPEVRTSRLRGRNTTLAESA